MPGVGVQVPPVPSPPHLATPGRIAAQKLHSRRSTIYRGRYLSPSAHLQSLLYLATLVRHIMTPLVVLYAKLNSSSPCVIDMVARQTHVFTDRDNISPDIPLVTTEMNTVCDPTVESPHEDARNPTFIGNSGRRDSLPTVGYWIPARFQYTSLSDGAKVNLERSVTSTTSVEHRASKVRSDERIYVKCARTRTHLELREFESDARASAAQEGHPAWR